MGIKIERGAIMTLGELISVFGSDTSIQICKEDDWEQYDSFTPNSKLLKPFKDMKVRSAEAIDCDEIRVDLDWSE